ncbi:TetR/AcrR family transcriptional regulator [Altererythrobacter sp. BO-6]|nr:TetR/AcrR family transcriptional regulator [Altererythrobacter sp. BO-6]
MSRETLMPMLAAHVLEHGLAGASLRPLARAAGTSDRMLLYHFGSKERLVADLLAYVAEVYAQTLDTAFGSQPAASRRECVDRILDQAGGETMRPFMALWWDIVSGSARGNAGYREAAHQMMSRLLEWLEAHMPPEDPDPAGGARYLMTLIEGTLMLSAVGCEEIARAALEAVDL